jgi:hypothetical protein
MQQVIKLLASVTIDANTLLLVDSDVVLVRSITADTFQQGGKVLFYRKDAAVDESLPRHLLWHNVAREILGGSPKNPPLPDYISAFLVWDRRTILNLQEKIQERSGKSWIDTLVAHLHFSEAILYGVFVDEVLGDHASITPTGSSLCHSYWGHSPLSVESAIEFLGGISAEDAAVMISAKSYTPLDVRREALSTLSRSSDFTV